VVRRRKEERGQSAGERLKREGIPSQKKARIRSRKKKSGDRGEVAGGKKREIPLEEVPRQRDGVSCGDQKVGRLVIRFIVRN